MNPAKVNTANAGEANNNALLVLDDVAKHFGSTEAVRGVSLQIYEGEFVALMGPSGCGKSTTLFLLSGLETPTRGEIRYRGARINEVKAWDRGMPMVWQNLALFPFLDVLNNVTFGLRMAGLDRRTRNARAMEWLARMEIAELADRDISILSGGQRQRVALARALVTEPDVLLLDEPLSALDAHLVVRMQSELSDLHRQLGITFVYVTHNQSEAFAMADRVVIMNNGRIEQIGAPRDLYHRPQTRFVAEFVGTNNLIPGVIKEVSGGFAAVDTPFGMLRARMEQGPTPVGQTATIVVRADLIHLTEDGSARDTHMNSVAGKLISEEFSGTVVTVHLDVGSEKSFRVQLQQTALDKLDIHGHPTLYMSWAEHDCFVLPDTRR